MTNIDVSDRFISATYNPFQRKIYITLQGDSNDYEWSYDCTQVPNKDHKIVIWHCRSSSSHLLDANLLKMHVVNRKHWR
jgi:hypothetical protein